MGNCCFAREKEADEFLLNSAPSTEAAAPAVDQPSIKAKLALPIARKNAELALPIARRDAATREETDREARVQKVPSPVRKRSPQASTVQADAQVKPPLSAVARASDRNRSFFETFSVLEQIGMKRGRVFVCARRDEFFSEEMAVKVVRGSALKRACWEPEVVFLDKCAHKHIVKLLDCFQDAERIYMVTELCAGGDLSEAIARERLRWQDDLGMRADDVAVACRHILQALRYLHTKEVAHRDVKPQHVFLSKQGVAFADQFFKLGDFSTAARVPAMGLKVAAGTEVLRSPEMTNVPPFYTVLTDMWSLGVLIHAALVASYPFATEGAILKCRYSINSAPWQKVAESPKSFIRKLLVTENLRPSAKEALCHDWLR